MGRAFVLSDPMGSLAKAQFLLRHSRRQYQNNLHTCLIRACLQDSTVRKVRKIPGLVLSGDLKVRASRRAAAAAAATGIMLGH